MNALNHCTNLFQAFFRWEVTIYWRLEVLHHCCILGKSNRDSKQELLCGELFIRGSFNLIIHHSNFGFEWQFTSQNLNVSHISKTINHFSIVFHGFSNHFPLMSIEFSFIYHSIIHSLCSFTTQTLSLSARSHFKV